MNCPHYSSTSSHHGQCALGWYGGHPFAGNCAACLKAGTNTPEAYAAAQANYQRTHPEPFRGRSGCCDDARNAP